MALLAAVLLLASCGGKSIAWSAVPPTPDATTYEGEVEAIVDARLSSIAADRKLTVVNSRLELLPAGVDWAAHRTWRDGHVGGLRRVSERLPEPDAPVLVQQWGSGRSTVVAIGRATAAKDRLVVLTALLRRR